MAGFTAEKLSRAMDHHVDGVIGAETLRTQTLLIDPFSQEVTFSGTEIQPGHGVPVVDRMNVPIIDVAFNGNTLPTIFDTGALLGYVTKDMTEGYESVATYDDFYPLFGSFRTEVFEIPVRIGPWEDIIRFGVFPQEIEQMHAMTGHPTIIGLGLLKKFGIRLGLRERQMQLVPRVE